jgi:hypothetical protein
MQYLNVDYDPSLVQVASSLGQDLAAYTANERQRVMAARGGDVLMGPDWHGPLRWEVHGSAP